MRPPTMAKMLATMLDGVIGQPVMALRGLPMEFEGKAEGAERTDVGEGSTAQTADAKKV